MNSATTKTAATIREGQRVRLADREPEVADPKGVSYYQYYRNLTGTVSKLYPDGTAAITIDRESLPQAVRVRHEQSEKLNRDKWLGNLGEEERERLSGAERQFSLRYTILVNAVDCLADGAGPAPAAKAAKAAAPAQPSVAVAVAAEPEPRRQSLDEIAAAEERHLREIAERSRQQ